MIKLNKTQRMIYYAIGFLITVLILTLLFPNSSNNVQFILFIVITILQDIILKILKNKKIIVYI